MLAIKYQENNKVFYALPGGGHETGESPHLNLRRECQEELGIHVKIGELLFVREWLDAERYVHQIEFFLSALRIQKLKLSTAKFLTEIKLELSGYQLPIF